MANSWVEIDLAAVRHNVRTLASRLPPGTEIIAMVKSDAYGHGAERVARAALQAGATRLGVAQPDEGAELRVAGIAAPILVLGGYVPEEADKILRYGLTAVLGDSAAVRDLEVRARRDRGHVPVHLHVDTGMCRLGVSPRKASFLAANIARSADLALEGVSTHLATADEPESDFARLQIHRFREALDALEAEGLSPGLVHVANTAGVLRYGSSLAYDAVRPGLGLYGLYPSPACRLADDPVELVPALAWRARLVRIERVGPGTPVSYGGHGRTAQESCVGTISVGYGDGYIRALEARGEVLVGGRRCPVIGRITMDHLMVDLGPEPPARAGAVVTLVGEDGGQRITAGDLAEWSDRIPYEVTTALSPRVRRVHVGELETPLRRLVGAR